MKILEVWDYLNSIKEETVKILPEIDWLTVKEECDNLFSQATNYKYNICPAWFFG